MPIELSGKGHRLEFGWVKLYMDGFCWSNLGSCCSGGIIWDRGTVVATFSEKLGSGTKNGVELQASISGIWFSKELGYTNVQIESDSEAVVGWMKKHFCYLWYLWDYWESLKHVLQRITYTFRHIFREANKVADYLTRVGENRKTIRYLDGNNLPRVLCKITRLDKLGLPNWLF